MKHLLVVLGLAAACDDNGNQACPTTTPCPTCAPCPGSPTATVTRTVTGTPGPAGTRTPTAVPSPTPNPTPMAMAEVFLDNANLPVSLAFAPDGRQPLEQLAPPFFLLAGSTGTRR
jgi:hypothetical protein